MVPLVTGNSISELKELYKQTEPRIRLIFLDLRKEWWWVVVAGHYQLRLWEVFPVMIDPDKSLPSLSRCLAGREDVKSQSLWIRALPLQLLAISPLPPTVQQAENMALCIVRFSFVVLSMPHAMAEVFSSKPWERKRYTTYETGWVDVSLACPADFSLSCKPICCDGGLQHLQDPRCQWSVLQGFLNSQISEIAESVLSLNLYPHDMKLQMFLYSIVRCIIPFMLLLLEMLYYFVLYRYFKVFFFEHHAVLYAFTAFGPFLGLGPFLGHLRGFWHQFYTCWKSLLHGCLQHPVARMLWMCLLGTSHHLATSDDRPRERFSSLFCGVFPKNFFSDCM